MLSPPTVTRPWLHCMQERLIVYYKFIHVWHAATMTGVTVKDYILYKEMLCFYEMHLGQMNKRLYCLQRCFNKQEQGTV